MSHAAWDWHVWRTMPGRRGRPPPWTFPFSACHGVASVNDQQSKGCPRATWGVGPVPFFPWDLTPLHVADHLVTSGWTA